MSTPNTTPHYRSSGTARPIPGARPPQHDAHVLELVYVGHTWGHTDPKLQKVYKTMLARAIFDQIKNNQLLDQ